MTNCYGKVMEERALTSYTGLLPYLMNITA